MLKIALDLDNTILNTPACIINLHNKLSDNKLEYNDSMKLGWKFDPIIKADEELAELFKLFDHPEFYKEAITYENAIHIINDLSKQNYICIISKHQDSRRSLTRKWVYETFPTVDLVFVDDFKQKGKILKGFDIILDDRIDALESCNEVKCKLCYGNYSWNREWTGFRVNNWLEFKEFVDKLQKLKYE